MKGLWIAPVLACCMTGCLTLPTTESKPAPTKATATVVTPKAVVQVEQISDANAKEMSLALSAELDDAQKGVVITPDKPEEKPKK
jgi:hypothetical protein